MKIFIVQAEHPYVPGRPMTAHATPQLAAAWAAGLLNSLIEDCNATYGGDVPVTDPPWENLPKDATAENWENRLAALHAEMIRCQMEQDEESAQGNCDVWVVELELQTEPVALASGDHTLKQRARIAGIRDMDSWTMATMDKFADENGLPPAKQSDLRRSIVLLLDQNDRWVEFCQRRGIPISEVPIPNKKEAI